MSPAAIYLKLFCPASRSRGGALVLLLLAGTPLCAQDVMSHEELMRRARGLPPAKVVTNAPAPVVAPPVRVAPAPVVRPIESPVLAPVLAPVQTAVVARPVPAVEPLPAVTANSPRPKSKAPIFSDVPPDFSEPTTAGNSGRSVGGISPTAMEALDDKHLLAIGDRLSFRIIEDEEDPRPLVVTDSGELEVPLVGRFAAAGKSCKELATALKAEFEKEYYYRATVIIAVDLMARSRGKVYLVGPVRAPGPQEIPSDEVLTISKAVLRAGGFTDFADKKSVKVTRKSSEPGGADETFTVNVGEILEQGRTESDLALRPGDLVYIQERMIRF